jgi:hypothetical protein
MVISPYSISRPPSTTCDHRWLPLNATGKVMKDQLK